MIELIRNFTRKEWKTVLIFSLIIGFFSLLPFAYNFITKPDGWDFYFTSYTNFTDPYVYLQYIEQIKNGSWLIYDHFTLELPQNGVFNIVWLANGLFARIFHLRPDLAYQLFRLALLPLAIGSAYLFLKIFEDDARKNFWRLFFILFAGGVGLYYVPFIGNTEFLEKLPVDLWQIESSFSQSIIYSPHFVLSWAALFLVMGQLLLFSRTKDFKNIALAGFFSLIWFNFHPYYIIFCFSIIGLMFLLLLCKKSISLRRAVGAAMIYTAVTLPSLIYIAYMMKFDEFLSARNAQNITLTSSPLIIVIGYGFLFLLAIPAWIRLYRKPGKSESELLLLVWAVLIPCLIYLPFSFQRRLLMGWSVALTILTLEQIEYWIINRKIPDFFTNEMRIRAGFIFLMIFGTGFITFFAVEYAVSSVDYEKGGGYYANIPNGLSQSINFLKKNNQELKPVIAPFRDAVMLPAFANQRIYCCAKDETINYTEKEVFLTKFWTDPEFDYDGFLAENEISYILSENPDRRFADRYNEVFAAGQFRVYQTEY